MNLYCDELESFRTSYHEICKNINPSFSLWYKDGASQSATGIPLSSAVKKDFYGGEVKDILYRDLLRFNKQSLAFYSEIIPYFWDYFLLSNNKTNNSYTIVDIGARTGAGANLLGEMFSDTAWGYPIQLIVDIIDISDAFSEYWNLLPFVNDAKVVDLFDVEEKSYDICFCSHTIEHLDDPIPFIEQMKKVSRLFSIISCPFEEKDPIKGHHCVSYETIQKCNPKYFKTYKSVNRWKDDLECVVFAV